VNAIKFRPLPFQDEASLVDVHEWSATELCAGCSVGTSYATFRELQASAASAFVPFASDAGRSFAIYASSSGDPGALIAEVRSALKAVDPDQPIEGLQTMEATLRGWTEPARFVAMLVGSLAGVALLLANIGTYGVIAFMVSQRAREIGIRMALGASSRQVQVLMTRSGMCMAITGS